MQKHRIIIATLMICTLGICLWVKTGEECKAGLLDIEAVLATTPFAPLPAVEPEFSQLAGLGEFTIYHYCPCKQCTGDGDGITAAGTIAAQGRTIATDWNIIPPGTQVLIGAQWYVVEDSGSGIKGKKIDVFMASHQAALEAGVKKTEVFVLRTEDGRLSPNTKKEENEHEHQ